MTQGYDIKRMARIIQGIRESASALKEASGGIQAVDRNVERILATVKILEIDVSDVASIEECKSS